MLKWHTSRYVISLHSTVLVLVVSYIAARLLFMPVRLGATAGLYYCLWKVVNRTRTSFGACVVRPAIPPPPLLRNYGDVTHGRVPEI